MPCSPDKFLAAAEEALELSGAQRTNNDGSQRGWRDPRRFSRHRQTLGGTPRDIRHLHIMPRFYFDFEDGGLTIDKEGEEFADVDAARKEAVVSVGQYAMDHTHRGAEGRLAVRVRDDQGLVLEVTAIIETRPIRK
jgi:hypothetical protein